MARGERERDRWKSRIRVPGPCLSIRLEIAPPPTPPPTLPLLRSGNERGVSVESHCQSLHDSKLPAPQLRIVMKNICLIAPPIIYINTSAYVYHIQPDIPTSIVGILLVSCHNSYTSVLCTSCPFHRISCSLFCMQYVNSTAPKRRERHPLRLLQTPSACSP